MFGMGLRHNHFPEILSRLEGNPSSLDLDYFEIITENFFQTSGRPLKVLEKIREHKPISFHGVSLSIASYDDLDLEYLKKVKDLALKIDPILISDHLCWTGLNKNKLHNLLPFPYTEETLKFLVPRIQRVQDFLGRPLMLENLSAYLNFKESDLSEAQFLRELHLRSGCQILLDLNNVYVNAHNQKFDAEKWIQEIPRQAVKEIHLAGFSDMGTHYFDTHSCPVWQPVWDLYQKFKKDFPQAVTLIEWDEEIPAFDVVLSEVQKAKHYAT
jgi:uncharacterized protein (UPF0276 family)